MHDDTLPEAQLVDLVDAFYKKPELVTAHGQLYSDAPEDLPGGSRVKKTLSWDIVGSIYDVMQLIIAHAPMNVYTCRNLHNVPTVTMRNVNPVTLLYQTSEVKAEIAEINRSNAQQLDIVMESLEH